MSSNDCRGCQEYHRLSRRHFLGLLGGAGAAVATPAWLPRVVLAQDHQSDRDVLVSIFLRGGSDGLSLVVPHGERRYYDLRPTLAVAPPDSMSADRATDLDGFFGLPPAMTPLVDAYRDGALALIHACGLEEATRSHFNAQHFMEVGTGNPPGSLTSGWLSRHLQATAPTLADGLLRAVSIGAGLPRLLVDAPKTLPVGDPESFGFGGNPASEAARREAIMAMYAAGEGLLERAARDTLGTVDLLEQIDFAGYQPAGDAAYPENEFGRALAATAALIKAEIGVEAVAVDAGGWDTHELQGTVGGQMAAVMGSLAGGLAAFHRDLAASARRDVLVVAMSEFGRNVFENGSGGTDHGHGGVMLVLGDAVAGGRVVTEWPGLEDGQLFENQDLAITIDYRDVLSEILTKRLGNPDLRTVFDDPAYAPRDRGIILP